MSAPGMGFTVFGEVFADGLRPRARLSLSDWADAHRRLSAKGSSEPGPWRTSRTPFLRDIMCDLSESSPVQRVVVRKSTQVGLTEVGLNWIGYHIERQLGPMLVVVPTLEVRKRWVLQRLKPMLSDTEVLAAIASQRTRDSANSEDVQDYPGALVVLSGANSASSLRSMPIKHVLCDEVDDFPWQVGGEGDPLGLIQRRTANFPRRKVCLISSPTVKDASRIDEEYAASDQRLYQVPCPDCGHYQPLAWENLRWNDALTVARYICNSCGVEIAEHHKTRMLAAGRWVARYPERKVHGYHINGLYAPIGLGLSWLELARDWLEAQTDPVKLKRFINTALGEAWEDRSRSVAANRLTERAEDYALRQVPPGCLRVTAGVDTQDDRLAVVVVGWGPPDTAFVLDWLELPGDPGRAPVWRALTEYLREPLGNTYGRTLTIEATAIDTGGHYTTEVYDYVSKHPVPRIMAIKGSRVPNKPILSRPSRIEFNARGRSAPYGLQLWPVGTDTAKNQLYGRLVGDEGLPTDERRLRFSGELPEEFYQQLTAEVFDPEKNKWVMRRGRRNEALDCFVYATAAAHHPELRIHKTSAAAWRRLEAMLEQTGDKPAPEPKNTTRGRRLPRGVARR